MQFKQYLAFALSTGALLLGACSLPANASPTPDPLYIESIVQTRIAAIPTNTQPPIAALAATATAATPTATAPIPTPTLTLFYEPTITSTPSLMDCPLIVTRTDTKAGDMLHVRRCEDNLEYDLGPFAKGVYAAGPNQKFLVYITDDGMIYVVKIGDTYLTLVKNLAKERKFTAVNQGVAPKFIVSFVGVEPRYRLVLTEQKFKQKYLYDLPPWLTE